MEWLAWVLTIGIGVPLVGVLFWLNETKDTGSEEETP